MRELTSPSLTPTRVWHALPRHHSLSLFDPLSVMQLRRFYRFFGTSSVTRLLQLEFHFSFLASVNRSSLLSFLRLYGRKDVFSLALLCFGRGSKRLACRPAARIQRTRERPCFHLPVRERKGGEGGGGEDREAGRE